MSRRSGYQERRSYARCFPVPCAVMPGTGQPRAEPPGTLTSFFVLSSWKKLALILPADLQQTAPLAHRSSAPPGPQAEAGLRYLAGRDGQRSRGSGAGSALCALYTRWTRAAPPTRTAPRNPHPRQHRANGAGAPWRTARARHGGTRLRNRAPAPA